MDAAMTEQGMAAWLTKVLLRDLESVRSQLDAYADEEAIWQTRPGMTNTAGTLALHIAGNLQHFVGAKLGGSGYVRDRQAEFELRGVPRSRLLSELDRASEAVKRTLPNLSDYELQQIFPEAVGGVPLTTGQYLVHLAMHLGYHVGQLDYHRRAVTGEASIPGMVSVSALNDAAES